MQRPCPRWKGWLTNLDIRHLHAIRSSLRTLVFFRNHQECPNFFPVAAVSPGQSLPNCPAAPHCGSPQRVSPGGPFPPRARPSCLDPRHKGTGRSLALHAGGTPCRPTERPHGLITAVHHSQRSPQRQSRLQTPSRLFPPWTTDTPPPLPRRRHNQASRPTAPRHEDMERHGLRFTTISSYAPFVTPPLLQPPLSLPHSPSPLLLPTHPPTPTNPFHQALVPLVPRPRRWSNARTQSRSHIRFPWSGHIDNLDSLSRSRGIVPFGGSQSSVGSAPPFSRTTGRAAPHRCRAGRSRTDGDPQPSPVAASTLRGFPSGTPGTRPQDPLHGPTRRPGPDTVIKGPIPPHLPRLLPLICTRTKPCCPQTQPPLPTFNHPVRAFTDLLALLKLVLRGERGGKLCSVCSSNA